VDTNTQTNFIAEAQGLTPERQVFTPEQRRGFTTEDILWALGIWSVIVCLSPVIAFYMLMVA
jgi:hypothetical protein